MPQRPANSTPPPTAHALKRTGRTQAPASSQSYLPPLPAHQPGAVDEPEQNIAESIPVEEKRRAVGKGSRRKRPREGPPPARPPAARRRAT
jgi:hypothetical protein